MEAVEPSIGVRRRHGRTGSASPRGCHHAVGGVDAPHRRSRLPGPRCLVRVGPAAVQGGGHREGVVRALRGPVGRRRAVGCPPHPRPPVTPRGAVGVTGPAEGVAVRQLNRNRSKDVNTLDRPGEARPLFAAVFGSGSGRGPSRPGPDVGPRPRPACPPPFAGRRRPVQDRAPAACGPGVVPVGVGGGGGGAPGPCGPVEPWCRAVAASKAGPGIPQQNVDIFSAARIVVSQPPPLRSGPQRPVGGGPGQVSVLDRTCVSPGAGADAADAVIVRRVLPVPEPAGGRRRRSCRRTGRPPVADTTIASVRPAARQNRVPRPCR